MEIVGRASISTCGLIGLLALALFTTVIAVLEVRRALRPSAETDRRSQGLQAVVSAAVALLFWLLAAAVWLFLVLRRDLRAAWPYP